MENVDTHDFVPANPQNGDKKQTFAYDAQGRRVKKTVYCYTNGNWTLDETRIFTYDGWMECESMVPSEATRPDAEQTGTMVALAPSEGLRQRVPACGRWRNNMIEEAILNASNTIVDGCATARRWRSPELVEGSRNRVPACGRLRLQVKHYIWGNDLSGSLEGAGGVGGLLASTSTSSTVGDAFHHYDANPAVCGTGGNVIALSDATGVYAESPAAGKRGQ